MLSLHIPHENKKNIEAGYETDVNSSVVLHRVAVNSIEKGLYWSPRCLPTEDTETH